MRRALWVVVLIWGVAPVAAAAQSGWEVSGVGGVLFGYAPAPPSPYYQDDWFDTVQAAAIVGRQLSRHVTLELELGRTTTGDQLQSVPTPGGGRPAFITATAHTALTDVTASVAWVFRDNQWVQPFVQAGVSLEARRHSVSAWRHEIPGGRTPGATLAQQFLEGPSTNVSVRGIAGAGARFFVTPHVFLRGDGRVSHSPTRAEPRLAFRFGLGLEF